MARPPQDTGFARARQLVSPVPLDGTKCQSEISRLVTRGLGVVVGDRKGYVPLYQGELLLIDPRGDDSVDTRVIAQGVCRDAEAGDLLEPPGVDLHGSKIIRTVLIAALCASPAAFDRAKNLEVEHIETERACGILEAGLHVMLFFGELAGAQARQGGH